MGAEGRRTVRVGAHTHTHTHKHTHTEGTSYGTTLMYVVLRSMMNTKLLT